MYAFIHLVNSCFFDSSDQYHKISFIFSIIYILLKLYSYFNLAFIIRFNFLIQWNMLVIVISPVFVFQLFIYSFN